MCQMNCWEIKNCGYQPGVSKTKDLGTCPASTCLQANGINKGINGGRACWVIEGTLCGDTIQRGLAEKLTGCLECTVYNLIRDEEGSSYMSTKDIRKKTNGFYQTKM